MIWDGISSKVFLRGHQTVIFLEIKKGGLLFYEVPVHAKGVTEIALYHAKMQVVVNSFLFWQISVSCELRNLSAEFLGRIC